MARRSHDLLADGRRRWRSCAGLLFALFLERVQESSPHPQNQGTVFRGQALCRSLAQLSGRFRCGRPLCSGGLPIFPLLHRRLYLGHDGFDTDKRASCVLAIATLECTKTSSGGLCKKRKNKSGACPVSCWKFSAAPPVTPPSSSGTAMSIVAPRVPGGFP